MSKRHPPFTIGEYRLGMVGQIFYAYWYEPARRGDDRYSLSCREYEQAKLALADFVRRGGKNSPEVVSRRKRASAQAAEGAAPAQAAPIPAEPFNFSSEGVVASSEWMRKVGELLSTPIKDAMRAYVIAARNTQYRAGINAVATETNVNAFWKDAPIADLLNDERQAEFILWQLSRNIKAISVCRYNCGLSAAVKLVFGRKFASAAPKVILDLKEIVEIGLKGGYRHVTTDKRPRLRRLDVPEIGALLSCAQSNHIWRYMILALATLSRPDAIFDLQWDGQVDEIFQVLHLNPAGRRQTSKRRPSQIISPTLLAWLQVWRNADKHPHVVHYQGRRLTSVRSGFRNAVDLAGLYTERDFIPVPDLKAGRVVKEDRMITPYTLRRSMATLLFNRCRVPKEYLKAMMGHEDTDASTTSIYAEVEPETMEVVIEGIEKLLTMIQAHTSAPIRPDSIDLATHPLRWLYVGDSQPPKKWFARLQAGA